MLLVVWAVLLWLNRLLSQVPAIYVSPLILHPFSPATYVSHALRIANATQLKGTPLLAVVLVWVLIVFPFPHLFPLVCSLELRKLFFVHKKCGIPGLHVVLRLSHRSSRYTMIYFQLLCLQNKIL